jgi:hypothetical protein
MAGKIWVNKRNGSVLRIEWHNRELRNREQLRAMGLILQREPELKFVSEFGVTRRGFRFPSRCFMKESYSRGTQKDFIRLTVEIDYKNYNFFMVSSEVDVGDS